MMTTTLLCLMTLAQPLFDSSDRCSACHNGLTDTAGRDISIASAWRATMMANSSRDPYWQAAIRAETLDHPGASDAIQHECATCHMPMARHTVDAAGQTLPLFANLPPGDGGRLATLAADGASCTTCHQIQPDGFGTKDSFVGRFAFDRERPWEQRVILGPHEVKAGHANVMRSASAFEPRAAEHLAESEMCATCHTLYTHTLDEDGRVVAEFPEQMPYLEWKHSEYAGTRSCQSCHMPEVNAARVAVSSVLGEPRPDVSQHVFRGGNFFVLGLLNQHRGDLAVTALGQELDASVGRTLDHLTTASARLTTSATHSEGTLSATVRIEALTGHKLPSAYPSRRAWLHLVVTDESGATVFESGALGADGAIAGNDNDADAGRFEAHYQRITEPGQVQIYEAILGKPDGAVTTGLLEASQYLKDNRLLPAGFDKTAAPADVAVHGAAATDESFAGGGDEITYAIDVAGREGPFAVRVALRYQPIGFRWAKNIGRHASTEGERFIRYFDGAANASAATLASMSIAVP